VAARLDIHQITTRLALEDLNTAFTRYLDHGNVSALIDLFTEDALYTHGERRSEGRAAIEALFRRRAAGEPRTSRHICSGLHIEIEDARHAVPGSGFQGSIPVGRRRALAFQGAPHRAHFRCRAQPGTSGS